MPSICVDPAHRCGCAGGPPPPCPAPTVAGNVTGCNSLPLPGVTVEAHDATAGGTLLGTATTDSAGNYSLVASGAISGNHIVLLFTRSRFVNDSSTLNYTTGPGAIAGTWTCGATCSGNGKAMTVASGYHCLLPTCATPAKDTLSFVDPANGTATVTWTPGAFDWEGSLTVGFAAYCGCPARAGVGIRYFVGTSFGSPYIVLSPQLLGLTGCPDPAGGFSPLTVTGTLTVVSCEPLVFQVAALDCDCLHGGGTCLNLCALWPGNGGGTLFTVTE